MEAPSFATTAWAQVARDVVLDVKIVSPLAQGHVSAAAAQPFATAAAGENQKFHRYGALCTAKGHEFVPLVWENLAARGRVKGVDILLNMLSEITQHNE